MTATKFLTLGDAVLDENFPAVDLALRRGRHIDRDDVAWFGFLSDAADVLEPFYRRFGAELVYRSDGFYYLLPTNEGLTTRHLSVAEMLVGQAVRQSEWWTGRTPPPAVMTEAARAWIAATKVSDETDIV